MQCPALTSLVHKSKCAEAPLFISSLICVSNPYDFIRTFKCERPRDRNVCAVTGRPARYRDPVTGLPYSSAYAFKVIRDRYHKHLRTMRGNEEVSSYLNSLKALPTPPLSPRVSNVPGSVATPSRAPSNLATSSMRA
ncbi:hypothetical protein CAEBREN_07323 [Caenorhabditis brenneri]|uniref:Vps72/YL1 C-terminal domain-containing protein n=1 Tax=Caenorhabditis brenneri TaxID=135651 RepID=G0MEZ6_CAEBE|nr:hypothetical protein CAEBREN_07323 [Caenorhabditis brenneri]